MSQPHHEGAELWVSSMHAYREAKEASERGLHSSQRLSSSIPPASSTPYPLHLDSIYLEPTQAEARSSWRRSNRRVTWCLFNAVALVHAALFVLSVWQNSWTLEILEDNPLLGAGASALKTMGATSTSDIANGHQYWRLLVSPFLGAGVLHVWSNVTTICTFAMFLSNELPWWIIALLYLSSGISAVTTSANVGVRFITAAGSGPALGFAGASCMLLLVHHRRLRSPLLSWLLLAVNLTILSFIGATPFVDNSGNTAGFVEGLCIGGGVLLWQTTLKDSSSPSKIKPLAVRLVAFLLMITAVVIPVLGVIGLNMGLPVGGCCNDWVCAPSPWWHCSAAYAWPDSCSFNRFSNGSLQIGCPQGPTYNIPASLIDKVTATSELLGSLCSSFCS